MEDFNLITVDTLNKYFDILSKAGYVKNKEVNKVIILTFLSRLLNDFYEYITEVDYNDIIKSVYCLSDCLIRLSKYNVFIHFESKPVSIWSTTINMFIIWSFPI